jgi:hypothetical protein
MGNFLWIMISLLALFSDLSYPLDPMHIPPTLNDVLLCSTISHTNKLVLNAARGKNGFPMAISALQLGPGAVYGLYM